MRCSTIEFLRRKRRKANPARRARATVDLTQREFAQLLGVSKSVVIRWEKGGKSGKPNAAAVSLLQVIIDYPKQVIDSLSRGMDP